MGFAKDEFVITPDGNRGVITGTNHEDVLIQLSNGNEVSFHKSEIKYEVLPLYEEKNFFINHPNGGALSVKVLPIRYIENGISKIKFEIKTPLDPPCKIFRDEDGNWQIQEGSM